MALVRFDQDPQGPQGAGLFHSDGGDSAYLYEPDLAASLAANDASYDPQASMAGGAAPAAPVSMPDVGPNYSVPPPPAPAATPAPNMSVAAPGQQAPAPPPQAPPPPQVSEDDQTRAAIQGFINAPEYHAPVQGGLRPKSAEVITEGAGPPLSPEEVALWRANKEAIVQARMSTAAATAAMADKHVAEAEAALPGLQRKAAEAQVDLFNRQSMARQEMERVNGMLGDVATMKVDHNRFFAQQGAVGTVVSVIAQMLGAWGSSGGRGPNFAKQIMDDKLNHDIAEQREAIENGRANANNALKMIQERYSLTLPQAESALKMAQLGVVNAQLKQFENMKLSQETALQLNEWYAKNQDETFAEARKLWAESMGRKTVKQSMVHEQGSPGGYAKPTLATMSKRAEYVGKAEDVGAIVKPGGTEKTKTQVHDDVIKYGEKREAIEKARASVKILAEKANIGFDPETGRASVPEGHDIPGKGGIAGMVPNILLSQQGSDVRQAMRSALSDYIKATSGTAASDKEVDRLEEVLFGQGDAGMVQGLENATRKLDEEHRALDSTYGVDIAGTWNARKRQVVRKGSGAPRVGEPIGRVR